MTLPLESLQWSFFNFPAHIAARNLILTSIMVTKIYDETSEKLWKSCIASDEVEMLLWMMKACGFAVMLFVWKS